MRQQKLKWSAGTKMLAVASLFGLAALTGVTLAIRPPSLPAGALATTEAPQAPQTDIEREAERRFANMKPRVRLPNGTTLAPSNEAHEHQIKVNLYKGILAKEAEVRDPTFRRRAEDALAARQPMRGSVSWDELSGNREMTFVVEDSSGCGLANQREMRLRPDEVRRYPCLDRGANLWDEAQELRVQLEPIERNDPVWRELLRDTMKSMAAEARFARADSRAEP